MQICHITGTLAAIFCFGIIAGVDPDQFTSVSAVVSLMSGEAQEYRKQEEERLEILYDDAARDVELKEFSSKPYLLFYEDIEANKENWKNIRMSGYYGKDSVRMIGKK